MPSRYNLPHIDIAGFATAHDYVGQGSFGNPAARDRAEHGRRLQNELDAALAVADAARPSDARLEPVTGTLIEVELRKGSNPEVLNLKAEGIRAGAVKTTQTEDRVIALYVPDHARPVLATILDEYLNGPVSKKTGNPPQSAKVDAIEAFRIARLESVWTDDPEALPRDGGAGNLVGACGATGTVNVRSKTCARVSSVQHGRCGPSSLFP